jgi:hypothetical protein
MIAPKTIPRTWPIPFSGCLAESAFILFLVTCLAPQQADAACCRQSFSRTTSGCSRGVDVSGLISQMSARNNNAMQVLRISHFQNIRLMQMMTTESIPTWEDEWRRQVNRNAARKRRVAEHEALLARMEKRVRNSEFADLYDTGLLDSGSDPQFKAYFEPPEKLKFATMLLEKRPEAAERRLREIVAEHDGTLEAKRAAFLLKMMERKRQQ